MHWIRSAALAVIAVAALAACSSFNDPDDDPALCENGRHPNANGQCPNPARPMLSDQPPR